MLGDINKRWQSESGSNRVNRGGSWNNDARNCRSSNRNNNNPDNRNNNLGLRLGLSELRIARMSGYSDMCCKQIAILNAPCGRIRNRRLPNGYRSAMPA